MEAALENKSRITVITVCYNAEKTIEKTIRSVLDQTYPNLEYIIVDGASKDGTADIIRSYAADSRVIFFSEPDDGIYDAMNKGSRMATGDYIQFLNSGDFFVDRDVVGRIAGEIAEKKADILYGNIIYEYPDGSSKTRVYGQFCESRLYYLLGDCINHQAMFAKRECFQEKSFDTRYKVCADREWMLWQKKRKRIFRATGINICHYSLAVDSASVSQPKLYKEEAARCVRQYLRYGYPLYALVDRVREGKWSARVLHFFYKIVFLRK